MHPLIWRSGHSATANAHISFFWPRQPKIQIPAGVSVPLFLGTFRALGSSLLCAGNNALRRYRGCCLPENFSSCSAQKVSHGTLRYGFVCDVGRDNEAYQTVLFVWCQGDNTVWEGGGILALSETSGAWQLSIQVDTSRFGSLEGLQCSRGPAAATIVPSTRLYRMTSRNRRVY